MAKQAGKVAGKVVDVPGDLTPDGRERIMRVVLVGGRQDGEQVGPDIIYWPWSAQSEEKADSAINEIAERYKVELPDIW